MKLGFRKALFMVTMQLCLSAIVLAQRPSVTLRADTNSIRIGDQFHLFLEATHPKGSTLHFPAVPDTFSNLEILNRSAIDTLPSPHPDSVIRRQVLLVTSFDSGYHVILPFQFTLSKEGTPVDSIPTEPLLISVQSVAVDTNKVIKDIKGQVIVSYTWRDFLPWILGAIAAAIIIILVRKYLRSRKPKLVPEKPVLKRPAHEIALEALNALQEAKLWQAGNHKGYHSALSDILRTFIENRWQVMAMEMTTDEILNNTFTRQLETSQLDQLRNILELSDRVKFAKWVPLAHENEESIRLAYAFVEKYMEIAKGTAE